MPIACQIKSTTLFQHHPFIFVQSSEVSTTKKSNKRLSEDILYTIITFNANHFSSEIDIFTHSNGLIHVNRNVNHKKDYIKPTFSRKTCVNANLQLCELN